MAYVFEADPRKAEINRVKHGVTFAEAQTAFADPNSLPLRDERHSISEDRYTLTGYSAKNRLLTVCYTEPGSSVIRIISAWKATTVERRRYEGVY
ncbi:MAG: BrnT family toxin [Chloroflexota bacterium]|nr:BrnT family toxin [Chloroflexota bacterium]